MHEKALDLMYIRSRAFVICLNFIVWNFDMLSNFLCNKQFQLSVSNTINDLLIDSAQFITDLIILCTKQIFMSADGIFF